MQKKTGNKQSMAEAADFIDTKLHILRAGRELLLAAQGALRFCKEYAEQSNKEKRNPQMIHFFERALTVAQELGADLKSGRPLEEEKKRASASSQERKKRRG